MKPIKMFNSASSKARKYLLHLNHILKQNRKLFYFFCSFNFCFLLTSTPSELRTFVLENDENEYFGCQCYGVAQQPNYNIYRIFTTPSYLIIAIRLTFLSIYPITSQPSNRNKRSLPAPPVYLQTTT